MILRDVEVVCGPRAMVGYPMPCRFHGEMMNLQAGWKARIESRIAMNYKWYVRHTLDPPRVNLLVLRVLCHRGRAHPPAGVLTRLFSANCATSSANRKTRQVALPDGPFRLVVAFWIQPLIF